MKIILNRILFVCVLATLFCTAVFAGGDGFLVIAPADGYYLVRETSGSVNAETNEVTIDPSERKYEYEFDANGNVTLKRSVSIYEDEVMTETITKRIYDNNSNLTNSSTTTSSYPNLTTSTSTIYVYDGEGKLVSSSTKNDYGTFSYSSESSYSYDEEGRLVREYTVSSEGPDFGSTNYYDSNGNITKVVYDSGAYTNYTYDTQGNCIREEQSHGGQSLYQTITYRYDNGYCIAYHQEYHNGDTVILTYDIGYKYDTHGNNTEMIVDVDSADGTSGRTIYYYEYEKLGPTKEETDNTVENPFSDVSDDAWYTDAVLWAVAEGITVGTGDGQFKPNDICDRGQVMTFLHRAVDTPAPTIKNVPFTDVKSGMWYTDAILWAYEEEISYGVNAEGTLFGLTDKMTRSQIVTLLYRLAGSPDVSGAEIPFEDVKADTWYTNAVIWAVQEGITTGTDKGFEPDRPLSRAETVTFLARYVDINS